MRVIRSAVPLALASVLAFVAGAASAQADQDEQILEESTGSGEPAPPPPPPEEELSTTYSSIGLNKVAADFENVEDAVNLDVTVIGFRVPTVPWFGIELNLGFTMLPGEVTDSSTSGGNTCPIIDPFCTPSGGTTTTSSNDFTATTVGVFGVLRSRGKFFVMGKYGLRYLNVSLPEFEDERSGNAYGLGIGYRWNRRGSYAELGYTKFAEKLDGIGFSISYSYDRDR